MSDDTRAGLRDVFNRNFAEMIAAASDAGSDELEQSIKDAKSRVYQVLSNPRIIFSIKTLSSDTASTSAAPVYVNVMQTGDGQDTQPAGQVTTSRYAGNEIGVGCNRRKALKAD